MTSPPTVQVTYQVHGDPDKMTEAGLRAMGETIAIGQTIGTRQVPAGLDLASSQAHVTDVTALPEPGSGVIRVAFPVDLLTGDPGTLLSVIFGKISMGGAIRLAEIAVTPPLVQRYQGPRWGIDGVRNLLGLSASQTPLMAIFKPCLGVPHTDLAGMLETLALSGVHLVKDDEVLSDGTLESARRRLAACLEALETVRRQTGRTVLYALNLTGPAQALLERAKTLVCDGANALLFNYLCYGLPFLSALREDPNITVPLVAHPALGGAFYGSPAHGISPTVLFGTLPRLMGADLVLYPSPYGAVSLPMTVAQAVRSALTMPIPDLLPAFPVPSAGIQAAMVPQLLADFGPDVVVNAGTGIGDHPAGLATGVTAFIKAMQPAVPLGGLCDG